MNAMHEGCAGVREALPGFVAGEPDEPALREHLTACAACRAEERRLAADVERLREGLAGLAPSAFLEDLVLEAARAADAGELAATPRERTVSWWVAGAALAAVFAAAVFLPRWLWPAEAPEALAVTPHADAPPGDVDHGPTRVAVPPPPIQIEKARAANRPDLADAGETLGGGHLLEEAFAYMPGSDPEDLGTHVRKAFPAAITDRAVQRWVYGDTEATTLGRILALSVRPRAGTVVLGRGLYGFLHREEGGKRFLEHGEKRLAWPTSGELEVTLLSPDRATQARVVAAFDPKFEGGVYVPGPLARALGLHQFEIPHGISLGVPVEAESTARAETWGCSRARVVVRIPDLDVEQILEAATSRFEGSRFSSSPGKMTHVLLFLGEKPAEVLAQVATREAEVNAAAGDFRRTAGVQVKYEPEATFLDAPEGASVTLRFARLGLADEFLVLGSFDPTHVNVDVERLQAVGTYPAGASATLARVWRGRTAVPSAEAVSIATVSADGTLAFLRRAGEEGATLRMRLVTREGRVTWHDVRAGEPERRAAMFVRVGVTTDGKVRVEHAEGKASRESYELDQSDLGGRDAETQRATLRRVLASLVGAKQNPALVDGAGASVAELEVTGEAGTPWRHVGWALETAQADEVRVRTVRFLVGKLPRVEIDLEAARPWQRREPPRVPRLEWSLARVPGESGAPDRARLTLKAFFRKQDKRDEAGHVLVPGHEEPLELLGGKERWFPPSGAASEREAARQALARDLVAEVKRGDRWLSEVRSAPDVAYEDVLLLLAALKEGEFNAVRFVPAATSPR
jgi:hypothetical protein